MGGPTLGAICRRVQEAANRLSNGTKDAQDVKHDVVVFSHRLTANNSQTLEVMDFVHSMIWVWVKIKPPGHVSIYQGSILGTYV